jgi:hypothetical protein
MTEREKALQRLFEVLRSDTAFRMEQYRQLALSHPSLAGALAELLAAHNRAVPYPLHLAATVIKEERSG